MLLNQYHSFKGAQCSIILLGVTLLVISVSPAEMAIVEDSTTYGGPNGDPFDDGVSNVNIAGIHTVNIRAGDQVDAIQIDYQLDDGSFYSGPYHGGYGGGPYSFTLKPDEYICKIEGRTGYDIVDQLTFYVKNSAGTTKTYGPFGKTGNYTFTVEGKIVAFHGGAGHLLDRIGFYVLEELARPLIKFEKVIGEGGTSFDDVSTQSGIVGVQSVAIRSGNQVDSIQVTYRLANGSTWQSRRHGGGGGNRSSFSLEEGDYISKVVGATNGVLVDQMTFFVTQRDGSNKIYGPYGKTGMNLFSVEGNIIAFFGKFGLYNLVDAIGFYYYSKLSMSEIFGGKGGVPFDGDPNFSAVTAAGPSLKISKLYIRSGDQIDSIQAEYVALGGRFYLGKIYGGTGGSLEVLEIGSDEVIMKMEGKTNGQHIDQLTFTMLNLEGKTRTIGPFGKTGQIPFSVSAPNGIQGFFGRADYMLDALGVYYY